ncbi:MAG: hypothetical protein IJL67_15045 [Oscillospiraceae bacterium]|nr:hypothetical protein [Oscillospiraceae bacterium]
MKSTLKAFKYSFKLVNPLLATALLILLFICSSNPILSAVKRIAEYRSNPDEYRFDFVSTHLLESSLFSLLTVWGFMVCINMLIVNCKFSYSVSFARKLHTIVPVIYAFIPVMMLFTITVFITAIELGSKAFSAVFIAGSICYSVTGIAGSVGYRIRRYAGINYILIMISFMSVVIYDDVIMKLSISAPAVIVLSYIILAAGFVFSCWYMNHLWDKGVRFIKHKHGFESLLGNK